ncbi:hypothetical protein, partial [Corynebacterium belfantii]|uniref:hypothetical protein n=1 Tax=Corynebacterium belfantii TaxID=2014537 RepID=UPI001A7E6F18
MRQAGEDGEEGESEDVDKRGNALLGFLPVQRRVRKAIAGVVSEVDDPSNLTWLNLVRRLGQLFGEFADVSGQVGLCMEGLA